MKRLSIALVLCCVAAAHAAPAKKKSPRVFAFREFTIDGEATESELKQLRDRTFSTLEAMLSSQGDLLAPQEEVRKVALAQPRLKDCNTVRCNAELGDALRANRLLTLRVEQDARDKTLWRVRLVAFNVDALTVAGSRVASCEHCSFTELLKRDFVSSTVNELLLAGDSPPALCTLKIDSDPAQATVMVDGEELGSTPFKRTIEARKYILAIAEKGYAKGEIVIECAAEKTQEVFFTLTPTETTAKTSVGKTPDKTPQKSIRHPLMVGLGVSGLVVGVPLLAVGATFVAYDGKGTCSLPAGVRQCERRANTLAPGIGLTVAGGLLAVGGAVLLIADALAKPSATTPRVSIVPLISPDALGLGVGGRL